MTMPDLTALVDLEAERAALGLALHDSAHLPTLAELPLSTWHQDAHRAVAQAYRVLAAAGQPADVLTVKAELERMGAWDPARMPGLLTDLLEEAIFAHTLPALLVRLKELASRRQLLAVSARAQAAATDLTQDWDTVLDETLRAVGHLDETGEAGFVTPSQWADELRGGAELPRLTTGLPVWDADGGLTYGDLHLLAARPGLGKTTVALEIARHWAVVQGLPVLFLSIEMSRRQIGRRLQRLCDLDEIARSGLLIADPSGPKVSDILSLVRRAHAQHSIQAWIVDHVQEIIPMKSGRDRRDLEIREIAQALRDLAKRLDIPCLAISQLNRDVEHRRGSPRPQLSDLRDGGALEEQAATVTFLWSKSENPEEQEPLPVTFSMRKNRHGRIREVEAQLERGTGRVR